MKKNLKACIEQLEGSDAQCLIDMNRVEALEGTGMFPDLKHKKNAHASAGWRYGEHTEVCIPMGKTDLSGYRYMTFSVFSVGGAGGSFRLLMESGSADASTKNGYEVTLPLTRDGWNDYRVELPFLQAVGEPAGWDRISSICLDCVAGGQFNRTDTVVYFDNFYVYEEMAAPLYATLPELKGAAAFSRTGHYAIVDRKRISNSIDETDAKPFEQNGILWVPMAPVAAGIAHAAVADNRAGTLSFTYRRKKYVFTGNSDRMTVNGEEESLGFFTVLIDGTLFFPAEFVRIFFHWRQMFIDPMGLIVLSNRRNVFDSVRDEAIIWQLIADMTFDRPTGARILEDLHRRFPNPMRGRLFASFDDLMQLRRNAKTDEALKGYVEILKQQYGLRTDAFAEAPIVAEGYTAEDLKISADKLIAFSMLFRVTGDKQYAERVASEAEALAGMTDWGCGSFATVATVLLGMSVAYDWCHHVWSEGRKAIVERAMLRNAMRPAVEYYNGKRKMWRSGGTVSAVVNAGVLASALTLADIYPETAHKLLDRVLRNTEPCFRAFAPDGGYGESVEAWEKSSRSLMLMIAMLNKACGSDYGLSSAPGFAATAYFPIHTESANGAWNYHNSSAAPIDTSLLFAFSRLTEDPVPAWMRRQQILSGQKTVHPFDILFYVPVNDAMTPHLPMDAVYRKAGLATMRAGWKRDDLFVGLHGGRNNEVNGDLDAGSVILDMGGERFFVDTGKEESLSQLLRRRAAGQNTVTVDVTAEPLPDQNPDANAPFLAMRSVTDRAFAIVDLTAIHDKIKSAKRGVLLTENRTVAVIQDEIRLHEPAPVMWGVWTCADVVLNKSGRTAKLTQNGKTLVCKLCGIGSPARFEVETVEGSAYKRLTVTVEAKEQLRMAVVCRLLGDGESASEKHYDVVSMSKWEI